MKISVALLVILFSVAAQANPQFECSEEAFLVEVEMPFSNERLRYCSIRHNGEVIKHGPYQRLNKKGVPVESIRFNLGKKIDISTEKPTTEIKSSKEEVIDQIFNKVFLQLFNLSEEKKLVIFTSNEGHCRHSPTDRAKFAIMGTPYSQKLKFDKNCFFEGDKRYDFNKDLTSILKSIHLNGYTSITLKYQTERKQEDDTIYINTTYRDSFIQNEKGEKIKFNAIFRVRVVPREVKTSLGRGGIYLNKLEIDIYSFHGEDISYKKSI